METPTQKLNASKRLEIAVKITQLQANHPKDAKNNPYPRSKYHQIAINVLARKLPNQTLNRILSDLGIEPRLSKKSTTGTKEFTSIRTQNVAEIKERLNLLTTRIEQVLSHVEATNKHVQSLDQRMTSMEAHWLD